MKKKPINTTTEGCAYTILAGYSRVGIRDLTEGGGHYPRTGVLEICEEEKLQKGLNTTTDGASRCLRASYYKIGACNVLNKKQNPYTAVLEVYEE